MSRLLLNLVGRRSLIACVLLICVLTSAAQTRRYFGRLVDKDNKGIPNSFIKAKNANQVFACDNKGGFSFSADLSPEDSLILFAQGFERASVLVDVLPEDSIIIEMRKNTHELQEFNLSVKWGRVREGIAGSTRSIHNAGCYLLFKDEIAMFLPSDSSLHGHLKEVNVFITKDGMANKNKFYVHIYRPDSSGAPGEEVTDTTLILNARKGNEWVTADLTNRNIQVNSGLFVSVEWTVGFNNDGFPWPLHAQTNYYSGNDSLRQFYNGQVLGLTWLDGHPKVYRRYARTTFENTAPDKWFLTPPLVGGCKRNECITPMMYYTYSYVEH